MIHSTLHGTTLTLKQLKGHAYNLDSILLANFIRKIPKNIQTIYDFGTGQGVLLFYLSLKTNAQLIGYDIQKSLVELANENIQHLKLEKQIKVIQKDIKEVDIFHGQMIISNPPYFKVTKDRPLSQLESRKIARHEVHLTLPELLEKVSSSLRSKGVFYMSYRPDRFVELVEIATQYNLQIKEVQYVHPYVDAKANLVLIKMIKDGNEGVIIMPPFILYEQKGIMTPMLKEIYGGDLGVT